MRHGTLTTYVTHKCRCEDCRRAHYRYNKRYRVEKASGQVHLVDAARVHAHLAMLAASGMSEWDICAAAGWTSRNSLRSTLDAKRVKPETERRILAITPVSDRRNRYVDATASRRRLQALAVQGWPYRVVAQHVGTMCPETIAAIQSGATKTIRAWVADEVERVYDELWDQAGPSPRSRSIATRKGWVPPMAWDDDTIADPAAKPRGIDPSTRSRDDLIEDFIDMRRSGATFANCAMRLGMTESALDRALHRARKDGLEVPDFNKENAA